MLVSALQGTCTVSEEIKNTQETIDKSGYRATECLEKEFSEGPGD